MLGIRNGRQPQLDDTTAGGSVDFSMNTEPFKENVRGTWGVAWSDTLQLFHGTITATILVVILVMVLV